MIYIIVALSLILPIAVILAYRQGIKDGRAIHHEVPLKPLFDLARQPKPNVEADRMSRILANVETYTGSAEGQKKVNK